MELSRRELTVALAILPIFLVSCSGTSSYDSVDALLYDLSDDGIVLCGEEDDTYLNMWSETIRNCTYKGVDLHIVMYDEPKEHAEETILGPTLAGGNWFIQVAYSSTLSSDSSSITHDPPSASPEHVLEEVQEIVGGEIVF